MTRSDPSTTRRPHHGFTLVELMAALIIFTMVATAGTYLIASTSNTQQYTQASALADSQIEFAVQRITDNLRAANAVSITTNSITITSPPSPLIGGNTFTISYTIAGASLVESCINNANGQSFSFGILVPNVRVFSVAALAANAHAYRITLTAGTSSTSVQRTFIAFARNL